MDGDPLGELRAPTRVTAADLLIIEGLLDRCGNGGRLVLIGASADLDRARIRSVSHSSTSSVRVPLTVRG